MTIALAFVPLLRAQFHPGRWIVGAVLLVLWAALNAFFLSRSVRRSIFSLEAATRAIADRPIPKIEPSYSDFDDLADAIVAASDHVENALHTTEESRRELEAMIDSMLDAVVAIDQAGRIQWTNQRMRKLMPTSPGGDAVRTGHSLVQTVRDPDVLECVRIALEDRLVTERRSTTLLPGKIFEVAAAPMPGGGAVAVFHDITRIEEVEKTQKEFVANVSHELRTPLTSITGYVETLLDHEQGLNSQAREFLTTIHKNATRMNRLTEDLLVMARVESSEQKLHPVPVPADQLVRDAIQAMSGVVQDEEAVLEVGKTTACEVFADQDAVVQVLSNLIENGIKYGKSKGGGRSHVIVGAREINNPMDAVEFSVQDFGQGIASEHLQRIFERFYRVDKARSRESGGTGLGLAIARHVVEALGGTIRAESELNAGSTFLFTLPKTSVRAV